MAKEIYYLSTCDTCKRIIKETGIDESFSFHDIKFDKITPTQLKTMKNLSGSYESLFSRKARKFKEMELNGKVLSDVRIRDLILEEYTFLKRPVTIVGEKIFIGNSPANVAALKDHLAKNQQ